MLQLRVHKLLLLFFFLLLFSAAFSKAKLCQRQQHNKFSVEKGSTAQTLKWESTTVEVNGEVRYNEACAVLQRNVIDFTEDVIYRRAFSSAEAQMQNFRRNLLLLTTILFMDFS